jgi:hypothetical protein
VVCLTQNVAVVDLLLLLPLLLPLLLLLVLLLLLCARTHCWMPHTQTPRWSVAWLSGSLECCHRAMGEVRGAGHVCRVGGMVRGGWRGGEGRSSRCSLQHQWCDISKRSHPDTEMVSGVAEWLNGVPWW